MSTSTIPIQETPPSAIVAELASTMPTPTVAEAPAQPATAKPATPPPDVKDVNGNAFDPAKHKVDAQGKPRFDSLGRFISTKQGGLHAPKAMPSPDAKPVSFIPEAMPTPSAATTPDAVPVVAKGEGSADKFTLLADVYTRAALSGLMAALGDEWQPDDDAEFIGLRDSVAAYLRATNREDLSPGWALTFAVATYGGKRIPRPKTQTRIAFFMDKLRAWWRGHRVSHLVDSLPKPEAR